jgi:hypothetical protein
VRTCCRQHGCCLGGIVAPVVEVAEAVELNLEPEVDQRLVQLLGVLADQLDRRLESRHGGLVLVVCGLDSA